MYYCHCLLVSLVNSIMSTSEFTNEHYSNNRNVEDNNLYINNHENISHNNSEISNINTNSTDSINNSNNVNSIDSNNNNVTMGFNNHSDNSLSKWREVYYFLLDGRKKYNNK